MQIFIRNSGIILCCIYYFSRLSNTQFTKKILTHFSIVSIISLSFFTLTQTISSDIVSPVIVLFLSLYIAITIKTSILASLILSAISLALSYITFAVSIMIVSILSLLLPIDVSRTLLQSFACMLQLILMPLPFSIKRLQKGMPFLHKHVYALPILIISLILILLSIKLNSNTQHIYYLIPAFFVFLLSLLIYDYWRSCLTKTYIDKLKDRSISDLNQQIAQQAEEIIQLKEENQRLSKIVHKDNKLIPTLEHSVYTFIRNNSIKDQDVLTESDKIIERFSKLSKERAELVKEQDTLCQKLSLTNVLSIDQYLQYFQCQAKENNIDFQTVIDCDVPHLIETIIEEYDLETLIQDLLDDALHATQANNGCYILLIMGLVSNIYTISIFDSGIPFPTEFYQNGD